MAELKRGERHTKETANAKIQKWTSKGGGKKATKIGVAAVENEQKK